MFLAAASEAVGGVPVEWLPNIGAGALLAIVILMILTGKLVPGRERDYWRQTALTEQANSAAGQAMMRDVLRAVEQMARVRGGDAP